MISSALSVSIDDKSPPTLALPSVILTPPDEDQPTSSIVSPSATSPTFTACSSRTEIPPFFFPFGKPRSDNDDYHKNIQVLVKRIYGLRSHLLEAHFVPVTKACGLPRFMNIAFFRRLDTMHKREDRIAFDDFLSGWDILSQNRYDDDSLFFNILRKPGCTWLLPEDFLPVLEDIVLNHPGLRFLADNHMFQERYIETVICRLYYEARATNGKMTLAQFRRSGFARMIHSLGPNVDLNSTRDCFSYKHFYVLYCKFWTLDDDHDLVISEANLARYSQAALTPCVVRRIMQCCRIPAFARDQGGGVWGDAPTLTYLDYIWFLLSEVDKSTPMAIDYWFRCMDTDGDGILSGYELSQFWQEQEEKQRRCGVADEDRIRFEDILCQMNDLIQPDVRGQFRLRDLKRNGYMAERFFDTFLNFDRFQVHEAYQGSIRAKRKQELERREMLQEKIDDPEGSGLTPTELLAAEEEINMLDDSLGFFVLRKTHAILSDWCEYAEAEYQQLLLSERNDIVWDDQEDEEEDEEESCDEQHLCDEDVDEEEIENIGESEDDEATASLPEDHGSSREEESSSATSDHDSDTSAPSTPTKDPAPAPDSWASRKSDGQEWRWHAEDSREPQPTVVVSDDEYESEEEEQREDRAAKWIWWQSRRQSSRLSSTSPSSLEDL
ncbi:hypothetical protein BCR43DRAFT_564877 [Syncephalastrum racemosum]|uniref:EF-hand domain-containing protein n=1 Tax=Syncephalastrum racemosum TaxID=13706 RepID=A0A1X2H7N3_SYNRA|nr:hypothetical protein BCR43DRAFT_564877 [Syncephalastrum racemosum]